MSQGELLARVEASHQRWADLIEQAGARVDEPGAAGVWTLRDVIAHINAYLRFLVLELGGDARPFGDLPDHDGNDVLERNRVLHEADVDVPWSDVHEELDTVSAALLAELRRRDDAQLARPMVDWAPLSIEEWVISLTEGHLAEHEADLLEFLKIRETPR